MFGFLKQCWYSYSYRNDRYVFGQRGMTCLRSSKIPLIPSKTKISPRETSQEFNALQSHPQVWDRRHMSWEIFNVRGNERTRQNNTCSTQKPQHRTQQSHQLTQQNTDVIWRRRSATPLLAQYSSSTVWEVEGRSTFTTYQKKTETFNHLQRCGDHFFGVFVTC